MHIVVVLSVLAAVSAVQISAWAPGKMPGVLARKSNAQTPGKLFREDEKKCCSEAYYTVEANSIIVSVKDGGLFTEIIKARSAYDSIDKKIGIELVLDFSNGTEDVLKFIADYEKGEGYITFTYKGKKECHKFPVEVGFPYNCLPEDSKFVSTSEMGDRALTVDSWYFKRSASPTEETHTVFSVTKLESECVDVSYLSREFDPSTGAEVLTDNTSFEAYNLGICDPDRWFKPPPECEEDRVTVLKAVPKKFAKLRGPGGKYLFL